MNLNPAARQRHQVRVITVGFFRMLKSMQTYKVIKTKTEIATLNEFLEWLEKQNTKDGIIFIYHDQRKFVPYILIEAFKKYNLLDRFLKIVKSFVNGYTLAEEKCANTIKYLSLHQLSTLLLKKVDDDKTKEPNSPTTSNADDQEKKETEETQETQESQQTQNQHENNTQHYNQQNQANREDHFEGNASTRAKLAYDIAEHLSMEDQRDLEGEQRTEKMNSYIWRKAYSTDIELTELKEQEENLVRQNSLRSVFLQYFRSTLYHRVKAVNYRRLLAEHKHDNDSLNDLWTNGKREAVVEAVNKIESLKDEEREELIEIIDSHYDPEKKSVKPVVKRSNSRRRRRNTPQRRGHYNNNNNKENRRPRRKSRSMSNNRRYNNNNNNNYNNNNNNNNMKNHNIDHNNMKMKNGMPEMGNQQQQHHNEVLAN